jgi:glutaryl-CoA dehydrogenase
VRPWLSRATALERAALASSVFYRIREPARLEVLVATSVEAPAVNPLDYLAIDALLDDEERAIRDTVRQFVRERVVPEAGEWFERGILPREVIAELAKLGLFGMHLEGYGCAGASAVSYGLACLELEAGDSGVRSACSVQGSLAMYAIWKWGSEEQKQQWLPRMASGEVLGCFGLTEPDAGSDPGTMRTHARRDGADWILNGAKMWITNGSIADIAIVWARTEDGEIRGFVVERGTPGFTTPDIHRKLSLRASITSELVLADVRVPAASMLPAASTLRGPLSCLNEARYGIVWGAVGAGRACFEAALDYAKERIVFAKPISAYQLTQQKLAEMALELNRGLLVALHLGRMKDQGTLRPEHVSLGKMGNVRGALEVCRSARTILGGNGITLEYPVIRHMNNLESVLTYEGTHEVHTLVVGGAITGVSAFR